MMWLSLAEGRISISIFVSIFEKQTGFFEKIFDLQSTEILAAKNRQSIENKGKSRNLNDCGIFLVVAEKEGFELRGSGC